MKNIFHGTLMKDHLSPSFLQRIRNELHQMHPAERRLADFLLSFPGELASYTASELAKLANVSNATVSRFVQRLGYSSYDDARRHVRSEQQSGAALFRVASPSDGPEQILQAHLRQGQSNVERTFSAITLQEIDAVVDSVLTARRVWVVGFRGSQAFATYFQWQALQVIEDIVLLPQSGHTLAEHIASMQKDDCAIIFGLRRRIREFQVFLGQICKSGAKTLLISDDEGWRSPLVTWHMHCQTAAAGPLYNHSAVMALTHLLATRIIDLAGPAGRRRLSTIEAIHEALVDVEDGAHR